MTLAFFDAVHADPWAAEFVDLPTLNANASSAIEGAIERTRLLARTEPRSLRSTSLVVLGPPGAGKTHLFTRLRRRLGPRAVFVHIRPLVHAEMTPRFVLGEIVRQLGFETQAGFPQVSALVGSLLGHLSGAGTDFPSTFVSELAELPASTREERLADALSHVLDTWQEVDETYLERLLAAPFATRTHRRALLAWLSGGDCEVTQLERIGATASLSEERALGALRSLSAVAALGAPIVLVFDQLENLVDAAGNAARLLAYSNLAAELVDTMRGLVVVQMALDTEWERAIEPSFSLSQRSRLVMGQQALELPDTTQREELLRLFVERIPERPEAFPWPLGQSLVAKLRAQPGLTPRMLLIACKRALEGEEPDPTTERETSSLQEVSQDEAEDALVAEWKGLLDGARKHVDATTEQRAALDAARLADGLFSAFGFVPQFRANPSPTPPTRLILETGEKSERIAILQELNHRSLASALSKLTTLTSSGPVVVLREQARELPPTWKETLKKRSALLSTRRARWIDIEPEDCARLLALDALLQAARSGDVTDSHGRPVTEASVRAWVPSALQVDGWGVIAALAMPTTQEEFGDQVDAEVEAAARSENGLVLQTLSRLRIASLDRLVREVSRLDRAATRTTVLRELEAATTAVEFVGRAIVCTRRQP